MKILLVGIILVLFLTGCETYQIFYGVPEKESNVRQKVVEMEINENGNKFGGLKAIVVCDDWIVCYESSHSYGVGLSCIELDELGVRGEKYSSKC